MSSMPLPRYRTDFNEVEDDGLLTSLPGWGGEVTLPTADPVVTLFDGDGNTCLGIVQKVDLTTGLIHVRPLWETWTDAPHSTFPDLLDALRESVAHAREQRTQSAMAPDREQSVV